MPRPRKRKPKREHLIAIPKLGDEPLAEFHSRGTPEKIELDVKGSEYAARKTGLNLELRRASGKSMVSMSGISEKTWNRIFGKKKRGKGGNK